MNNTKNAVDTVERQQRKAAQELATTEARVQELNTRLLKLENLGLESRMLSVEERVAVVNQKADKTFNNLCEACRNIVGTYVTIENNKDLEHMLDAKIDSVTVAVQALMSTVASIEIPRNQNAPQEFQMATPVLTGAVPPGIDPLQHDDAWAQTRARMAGGEPAAASVPVPNSPFNNPQQDEQPGQHMPQQYAPAGQPIPPRPPTFAAVSTQHAAMPAQQSPFQTPPPRGAAPAASSGPNIELMGNQRAMNRENKSLYKFSGQSADFKDWRDRFIDHMAMVHVAWRSTLIWMGQTHEDLGYGRLRHETMGPNDENSCELAVKLEQTICNYLPAGLYGRRVQLCGGVQETNNGFKMWKRLHDDHTGSGEIISYAGSECLREYPRCAKISETTAHIDGWLEMFDLYGKELENAPTTVRGMLLNIIPRELKAEILKEPELVGRGHMRIIEWIRRRCLILQHEHLAEMTRKQLTGRSGNRMNVFTPQQEEQCAAEQSPVPDDDEGLEPPAWFKNYIAANRQVPAPPAPHAEPRQRRVRDDSRGRDRGRGRDPKRSPRGSPGRSPSGGRKQLIDWGKKCFHCGSEHHTRDGCTDFNDMMSKHNGSKPKKEWRPPPGYKSAIGRARDAAKAKEAAGTKKKMAAVTADDDDTGSEDNYSFADGRTNSFRICAITKGQSVESTNPFNLLHEDQQDYDPGVLEALGSWAHKVHVNPKSRKKESPKSSEAKLDRAVNYINSNKKSDEKAVVVIRKDQLSDKAMRRARRIAAAVPQDKREQSKIFRTFRRVNVGPDEILAMIDTGSFAHAINARKNLPQHSIEAVDEEMRGKVAETACGGILKVLGSVTVNATADGMPVRVRFNDMDVQCAILSVRRLCMDGHEVYLNYDGGYIENMESGKRIPFFEMDGVYYIKLKIQQPQDVMPIPDVPEMPFTRQGA